MLCLLYAACLVFGTISLNDPNAVNTQQIGYWHDLGLNSDCTSNINSYLNPNDVRNIFVLSNVSIIIIVVCVNIVFGQSNSVRNAAVAKCLQDKKENKENADTHADNGSDNEEKTLNDDQDDEKAVATVDENDNVNGNKTGPKGARIWDKWIKPCREYRTYKIYLLLLLWLMALLLFVSFVVFGFFIAGLAISLIYVKQENNSDVDPSFVSLLNINEYVLYQGNDIYITPLTFENILLLVVTIFVSKFAFRLFQSTVTGEEKFFQNQRCGKGKRGKCILILLYIIQVLICIHLFMLFQYKAIVCQSLTWNGFNLSHLIVIWYVFCFNCLRFGFAI